MLDLGEEAPLGDGGLHGVRVPGVEQALEHHPAVADVAVPGQVDPAESAVRQAAEHLVLPGDEFAWHQLGAERVPGAAVRAEPLGQAGPAVARLADGLPAVAAEPPALRDSRVGQHRRGGIEIRDRRHHRQARRRACRATTGRCRLASPVLPAAAAGARGTGTGTGAGTRAVAGAATACGATARGAGAQPAERHRPEPDAGPGGVRAGVADAAAARRQCPAGGRRRGREPADVAVPVLDRPAASRGWVHA